MLRVKGMGDPPKDQDWWVMYAKDKRRGIATCWKGAVPSVTDQRDSNGGTSLGSQPCDVLATETA